MGWLVSYEDNFKNWVKDHLREWETDTHTYSFPKYALRGKVLWAVGEVKDKSTGEVKKYLHCDLVNVPKHDKDGDIKFGWGYKDIPVPDGGLTCPLSFIEETEPQDDRERQWRCEVRARYARTSKAGFKVGDWIKLTGCKEKFLRVTMLRPFRCGRYRVPRRFIDGRQEEMTALQQRVDAFVMSLRQQPVKPENDMGDYAKFMNSDSYKQWRRDVESWRNERERLLTEWGRNNPPGIARELWDAMGGSIPYQVIGAWNGVGNTVE